jgi:hypothetical protein
MMESDPGRAPHTDRRIRRNKTTAAQLPGKFETGRRIYRISTNNMLKAEQKGTFCNFFRKYRKYRKDRLCRFPQPW